MLGKLVAREALRLGDAILVLLRSFLEGKEAGAGGTTPCMLSMGNAKSGALDECLEVLKAIASWPRAHAAILHLCPDLLGVALVQVALDNGGPARGFHSGLKDGKHALAVVLKQGCAFSASWFA